MHTFGDKTLSVSIYPPPFCLDVTQERSGASAVRNQWLTASVATGLRYDNSRINYKNKNKKKNMTIKKNNNTVEANEPLIWCELC